MALPLYKRLIVLRLLPSLFLSQVTIELCSSHVAVITTAAGFKQRVIDQQFLALNSQDDIFGQLATVFTKLKLQKNSLVKVVLASEFVRYLALPAYHISISAADKNAYARAAYREVYGNLVDVWQIQCDDAAPNKTTIVVAIDQKFITHLTAIAEKHGLELMSVQPKLMLIFNQFKHELKSGDVYFCVVDSNRLLFAYLKNGHWQSLRSLVLEADWQAQLASLAKREQLLTEHLADKKLMIYAPSSYSAVLPVIDGWTVKYIGLNSINKADKNYSMLEVA